MRAVVDRFNAWSLDLARDDDDPAALLQGIVDELADLPLVRVATSFRPLDPLVWAQNLVWERDRGISSFARAYDITSTDFVGSAPEAIFVHRSGTIRDRLEHGSRFKPVDALVRQRATDYLVQPIELGRGFRSYISYAIDRPGGFTDDELALLEAILPAVSNVNRLRSEQLTSTSLLRTYLGHNAAERVLSGDVRRGTGERIHAAIWFCDLRGFTVLSQQLPPDQLLQVLDRYFEAAAGPIVDGGGEILKFIGDAMLAIFPAAPHGVAAACRRAAVAATTALDRFAAELGPGYGMGLALHVGEVFYGNIGARGRLDFTVIGPAVNLAARVQGQCTPLGTPLLMTGAFATHLDRSDLVSLGTVPLKGIDAPAELLTLRR